MAEAASLRLDKWLWHARFCRTRGQAAALISKGRVRVNARRVTKPATAIRIGDGLSFAQGSAIRVLRVTALGARRGPASEARLLYAELVPYVDPGTAGPLEPTGQPVT